MIYYEVILPADRIAGGVRTIYRQVETLVRHGLDACVINPHGHPTWFTSEAPVLDRGQLGIGPRDVVVFPEAFVLDDPIIQTFLRSSAAKHCFCQNHFNVFLGAGGATSLRALGIDKAYSCSPVISRYLEAVFGYTHVPVIPCAVDPALFRPGPKSVSIAYMPRKLPKIAEVIRQSFRYRHPDLAQVPWIAIEGRSETETAEILSRAGAFLSLSSQEGLGLPPLEAMAAGCAVVGFHGGGGREYATSCNGLWYEADQLLECVDGLAQVVRAMERDEGLVHHLREHGRLTADAYSPQRMETALLAYFRAALAAR